MNKKLFIIPFFILVAAFSGCKKSTNNTSKESFFSKVKNKVTGSHKKQTVEPFSLDEDTMKSFALDDTKTESTSSSHEEKPQKKLFSWEDMNAEESKNQFKTLYFEFDKYHLQPSQNAALKQDIEQAKKSIKDGKLIVIEGHACHSAGSAIYNLTISEQRARYVAKKFADAGIDAKNIKIAPRGQEMPVKKGGNREEQAVNRRVEIFAIDVN